MIVDFKDKKLELNYPCSWDYKVIGLDEQKLRLAIKYIFNKQMHDIKNSNVSRTGKYVSLHLSMTAENEENRLDVHQKLQDHPDIKMVL